MLPKIIIIIVIIILGFLVLGFVSRQFGIKPPPQFGPSQTGFGQDQKDGSYNYFSDVSNLPSCGDKKEFFTKLPLSLDSFTTIDPLGLLSPTAHVFPAPHLYFRIKREGGFDSSVLKFPVYAPADSTVTEIALIQATNKPELVDDAAVHFSPCSEFKAYFDHVVDLSPKIQEAYDKAFIENCSEYTLTYRDGPVNWKNCHKREAIERIPLLKWYFALFEQSLFRQGTKLVVIGYSFKDKHINSCTTKAVNEYGLKLYIISTEAPDKFAYRLKNKYSDNPPGSLNELDDQGLAIWNAIEGYFPYQLKRILPLSQIVTAEKSEVFGSIGIPLTR